MSCWVFLAEGGQNLSVLDSSLFLIFLQHKGVVKCFYLLVFHKHVYFLPSSSPPHSSLYWQLFSNLLDFKPSLCMLLSPFISISDFYSPFNFYLLLLFSFPFWNFQTTHCYPLFQHISVRFVFIHDILRLRSLFYERQPSFLKSFLFLFFVFFYAWKHPMMNTLYIHYITNSMAYETRRFNAAFTRALQ